MHQKASSTNYQKMIRITAVSYLNTKPFLYGLLHSELHDQIEWQLDVPKGCAERLRDGRADIGLVPVAVIPQLDNPKIISEFCIGAVGAVKTVCLYSRVPIEQIRKIYLDFESRTSVELLQILLNKHWNLNDIHFLNAVPDYEKSLSGTTAGLVIGDKTMGLDYPYVYDLAEAWQDYCGKPFVFAAWVTNGFEPEPEFLTAFNRALAKGLDQINDLMLILPNHPTGFDLEEYFRKYISYPLDAEKQAGLQLFLTELGFEKPVEYRTQAGVERTV
jgi:chorismate dehydratase